MALFGALLGRGAFGITPLFGIAYAVTAGTLMLGAAAVVAACFIGTGGLAMLDRVARKCGWPRLTYREGPSR